MRKIFAVILSVCACVLLGACGEQTAEKDYEGFEGVLDFGAYSGVEPLNDETTREFNERMEAIGIGSYSYRLENWDENASPAEVYFGYIDKMEERGFTSDYDREQENLVLVTLSNEKFVISTTWSPQIEEVGILIDTNGN